MKRLMTFALFIAVFAVACDGLLSLIPAIPFEKTISVPYQEVGGDITEEISSTINIVEELETLGLSEQFEKLEGATIESIDLEILNPDSTLNFTNVSNVKLEIESDNVAAQTFFEQASFEFAEGENTAMYSVSLGDNDNLKEIDVFEYLVGADQDQNFTLTVSATMDQGFATETDMEVNVSLGFKFTTGE